MDWSGDCVGFVHGAALVVGSARPGTVYCEGGNGQGQFGQRDLVLVSEGLKKRTKSMYLKDSEHRRSKKHTCRC